MLGTSGHTGACRDDGDTETDGWTDGTEGIGGKRCSGEGKFD